MKRFLAALVVSLAAGAASAQQSCYEWRYTGIGSSGVIGSYGDSPAEAVEAAVSYCAGAIGSNGQCWTSCGDGNNSDSVEVGNIGSFSTFPGYTGATIRRVCSSNGYSNTASITISNRVKPGGCPVCPAGEKEQLSGTGALSSAPSRMCYEGCEFTRSGGGVGVSAGGEQAWTANYRSTGSSCGSAAGNTGLEEGGGGGCVSGGDTIACGGGAGSNGDGGGGDGGSENCGEFNGDRVCPTSVPPGTCVQYASGGVACVSDSSGNPPQSPPAPDSGTPGDPAEADGVVEVPLGGGGGSVTGTYYAPGTVGGSGSTPSTGTPGGVPVGTPGTGSGTGEDDDDEEEPSGTCEGTGCNQTTPSLDDIGTVSQAMAGFWTELQSVPLVTAAAGLSTSVGTGACPNWETSVAAFGDTWEVDFSFICTMWEDIAGVLTVVMLVFWGFIAFRILFSA